MLSVIVLLLGGGLSIWLSVKMANGTFYPQYSSLALIIGLILSFVAFGVMRLAKAFVSYMLVRLLQTEED